MKRHHVATLAALADGHTMVKVNGLDIGLYRVRDRVYAWRSTCPHQGAPVCRGTISGTNLESDVYEYRYGRDGEILQCPWHGWEFDLTTGHHLVPQSKSRLHGYEVEIEGEDIYLYTRA